MKKPALLALTLALCLAFCGCSSSEGETDSQLEIQQPAAEQEEVSDEITYSDNAFLQQNYPTRGTAENLNTRPLQEGEEIAIVTTSMGEFRVRFFPEVAPLAVENFKQLATSGRYNNTIFFRVINNFMIQGGDTTNTGSGFDSFNGGTFADEFSEQALHLRGALCMANQGTPNTNGCQFYVVQAPQEALVSNIWTQLREKMDRVYPDAIKVLYQTYGGCPWLDFSYTVFGQVYEGMDVVDAIAAVPTNEQDKPDTDVVVQSVTLSTYTAATDPAAASSTTSTESTVTPAA